MTIGVVIPCYNLAQYVPDALASLLDQTVTDWRAVIVDDAGRDGDALNQMVDAFLRSNPGRWVRLVHLGQNRGVSEARNIGIRILAQHCDTCLPLDADDVLLPDALEVLSRALERNPDADLAYGDYIEWAPTGASTRVQMGAWDREDMRRRNQTSYMVMFRTRLWQALGGYRPQITMAEDWDFSARAMAAGKVGVYVLHPTFKHRTRHDSKWYRDMASIGQPRMMEMLRASAPEVFA